MVNPTGYTALDLIGFTDKDTYSSSANYVKNDLVHYGGNIWRCLIDDTSGIAPAEGVNWTLFIGEPTNLVERIIAPVETDPATNAWAVGRQIIFNDNLYEVIAAITAGDALVTYEDDPTNANIKLADPVETQVLAQKTQIQTLTNQANDMVNVLGAKNQLKYSLTSGTTNEVAYTVNPDKTISVTTTEATASSRFIDMLADLSNLIHGETYILNGCPSGGAVGTYVLYLDDGTDYVETGNGVQFVYDSNKTYALRFVVYTSVNLPTPIVFKPMIRLASIVDDTYVPFAKTNQQLTEELVSIYKQNIQSVKDSIDGVYYIAKSAVTGKNGVIGFWLQDNNDLIITRMWENDYNYYFFIWKCVSNVEPYTGTAPTITINTYI